MAQPSSRTCRNCGAPLISGQRFCSSCGTLMEEGTSNPTTPSNEGYSPVPDMQTIRSTPVIPPPPPLSSSSSGQSYTQYPDTQPYMPESVQGSQTPPPLYQSQSAPDYARPQSSSATPILRRIGCGLGVLIILFLALCGTGGYFAFHAIQNAFKQTPGSTSNSGGSLTTGGGYGSTATPGKVTTTPINATITYASVAITMLDVKQAQSFSDDTSGSASPGVLRLDVKEQNVTNVNPNYLYSDIMRLILPNQTSVTPLNAQQDISPGASTTRTNWIDFAVPATTDVTQTMLQLGSASEAQMSVALTGHADLSKYQAKTATISKAGQYGDLKWTIKTATRSWSNQGKQATKGMYYLFLDMNVDNPSSNDYSVDWESYMRMSAGGITGPDDSANIPITIKAGSSGQDGTVAFLVPQSASSYTFILLQNSSYPSAQQMTISFQM
ncbi:MAG TPA: hypothetical protein DHW02_08980 [Ktedonobacter sp.]|nr:hypothetical protein [Ktedonobacter sp.]